MTLLPPLPVVELDVVRDRAEAAEGFLWLRRLDLVLVRGASRSPGFPYDVVSRRALDACVIVAHHEQAGRRFVWLMSSLRPPLALRTMPPMHTGGLWEVSAGLIEPGETPVAAAARELDEELGFASPESSLVPLGEWMTPAPALIGEVHHFFHVEVDPENRRAALGDGSPLENGAAVVSVPLERALRACKAGEIRDAKTELALRRLADVVGDG